MHYFMHEEENTKQDVPWKVSEEVIAKMFPKLKRINEPKLPGTIRNIFAPWPGFMTICVTKANCKMRC